MWSIMVSLNFLMTFLNILNFLSILNFFVCVCAEKV